MKLARLELALDPLPVARVPVHGESVIEYGFALRLPDGAVVLREDPLLRAFATTVTHVVGTDPDDESLQRDVFAPGRPVSLRLEGVDDDVDEIVAVWDADGISRAGTLPYRLAARVAAADEHGLELQAVALTEHRTRRDDRRSALTVVIAPLALVAIDNRAAEVAPRRRRPTRPRLVLVADGRADLRWWDPSASSGPIPLTDVPVSGDLAAELARLSKAYAEAEPPDDEPENPFDALGEGWARDVLHSRVRAAWARARAELGRSYAVGLLAPGMERPAWSPADLDDEDDEDDVPF